MALLAAGVALLLLALFVAHERRDPGSSAGAPVEDAATQPGEHLAPRSTAGGERAPVQRPSDPLGALNPHEVWRGQVAAAVRRAALQRLGRPLASEAEALLVDAIATVGPAARGLDRDRLDPDDPASIAAMRERTAALVAADQVCRDELGIGIAELMHVLAPGAIEDGAASPAPAG